MGVDGAITNLVLGALAVAGAVALVVVICQDVREAADAKRVKSAPRNDEAPMDTAHVQSPQDKTQMPEAARPDEFADPWVATYCPGCLTEARTRFPNIEPAADMVPLSCGRHSVPVLTRQRARLRLACGQLIERDVVEVAGYARMYAATNEEVAERGWARCLWN